MTRISQLSSLSSAIGVGGELDLDNSYLAIDRTGGASVRMSMRDAAFFPTLKMFGGKPNDTSSDARNRNTAALNKIGGGFGRSVRIDDKYYVNNQIIISDSRVWIHWDPKGVVSSNKATGPMFWNTFGGHSHVTGAGTITSDGARLTASAGKMASSVPANDGFNCGFMIARDLRNAGNDDNLCFYFRSNTANENPCTNPGNPNLWLARSFPHHYIEGLTIEKQPGCGLWVSGVENFFGLDIKVFDCGLNGVRIDGSIHYLTTGSKAGWCHGNGIVNSIMGLTIARTGGAGLYWDNSNAWNIQGLNISEWAQPVLNFAEPVRMQAGAIIYSSRLINLQGVEIFNGPSNGTGDARYCAIITDDHPIEQRTDAFRLSQWVMGNHLRGLKMEGSQRCHIELITSAIDTAGANTIGSNILEMMPDNSRPRILQVPQHDGVNWIIPTVANWWHSDGGSVYQGSV